MTPTILLYILDGLDDLTTLLFTHYFYYRLQTPEGTPSFLLLRYARTAYKGGPSPRCYASDPLPFPGGCYAWSMLLTIMCSPLGGKGTVAGYPMTPIL